MKPSYMLRTISTVLHDNPTYSSKTKLAKVKLNGITEIPFNLEDETVFNITNDVFTAIGLKVDSRKFFDQSKKTKCIVLAVYFLYSGYVLEAIIWLIKAHYRYPKRRIKEFMQFASFTRNNIEDVKGNVAVNLIDFNLFYAVDREVMVKVIEVLELYKF
jgi:hypothetical protein